MELHHAQTTAANTQHPARCFLTCSTVKHCRVGLAVYKWHKMRVSVIGLNFQDVYCHHLFQRQYSIFLHTKFYSRQYSLS